MDCKTFACITVILIIFVLQSTMLTSMNIQSFINTPGEGFEYTETSVTELKVNSIIECASAITNIKGFCTASYDTETQICYMNSNCCPLTTGTEGSSTLVKGYNRPKDCSELPIGSPSGVYKIYPDGTYGFDVYCDDGWAVFQRRFDGSTDFFRTWQEYKNGFGDIFGEHWLGNDKLHILTSANDSGCNSTHRLRVVVEDFENRTANATYDVFHVANESLMYKLTLRGYSGTAGDSLLTENGVEFSTQDQDNDLYYFGNCAQLLNGGWWYFDCSTANPNGIYRYMDNDSFDSKGIYWKHWFGRGDNAYYYGLFKRIIMLVQ